MNFRQKLGPISFFFFLLFLFAKWGPSLPVSVLSQQKGEPLVVQGTGRISVAPDIARVDMGIQENGSSLKTVQDSVNKKSKTLVDGLKKLGIDGKNIKTTSYSVYPNYDYTSRNSRITGYQVSINYEVTIDDFDKVNDALTVATQNGANVVGGVNFEVNDKTKKEKLQEAREEAVNEAKEKAGGLAKAANMTLGRVVNISESQGFEPRPLTFLEKAAGAPADVAQPEITPGETELSVTVSLSYEIR
ncbi:MAG: 26 kDa periplasmic immunogenic protein [Candidatus Woesebacteria bacterium GW2011_GWB1_45_5]|uniref:26 kDa periplasmic immunogenic protein n=1 Tax=Candidatus Woesebacteria bacterium GW2011_GWB1_45_5 TaxID=1618581 RepID=A0A0G1QNT5_9BACT|nr:MAG: 26 kDa periplasmic immunogenic protein [Candidatus Woesebacteria bacterium GW2011_GWB1_45_5]